MWAQHVGGHIRQEDHEPLQLLVEGPGVEHCGEFVPFESTGSSGPKSVGWATFNFSTHPTRPPSFCSVDRSGGVQLQQIKAV
jgi:hypothetical protein